MDILAVAPDTVKIRAGVPRAVPKRVTTRAILGSSLWESAALAYAITGLYHVGNGGDGKLKHYECVEVKHHKDVPRIIEEYERNGWHLHTYQTAGMGAGPTWYAVNHYLLFERDK
jgi:hypothetical protein